VALSIDWPVFAFTTLVAVSATMIFGTAPALTAARTVFRSAPRGAGHGRLAVRRGLVTA
jgi:hypothetical protein